LHALNFLNAVAALNTCDELTLSTIPLVVIGQLLGLVMMTSLVAEDAASD
jgi:hypothetical protein